MTDLTKLSDVKLLEELCQSVICTFHHLATTEDILWEEDLRAELLRRLALV